MGQNQLKIERIGNLEPFFNPKKVLICGASNKKGKFGYQIVKNLETIGYKGEIFLVNPNEDAILGIETYKTIRDVPGNPELAIIVLPPQKVMRSIETCINRGIKYLQSGLLILMMISRPQ
ncbi:MAG: CoA-binding protein [Candidatus Helarchaeota archaeon]